MMTDPRLKLKEAVESTPEKDESFKFYCPICMMYFKKILKSQCCSQNICRFCISDMNEHRERNGHSIADMDCPFCTVSGVHFVHVSKNELNIRSYEDEVQVKNFVLMAHSPLKPSDSYEVMRKKLIPLKSQEKPQQIDFSGVEYHAIRKVKSEPSSPNRTKSDQVISLRTLFGIHSRLPDNKVTPEEVKRKKKQERPISAPMTISDRNTKIRVTSMQSGIRGSKESKNDRKTKCCIIS